MNWAISCPLPSSPHRRARRARRGDRLSAVLPWRASVMGPQRGHWTVVDPWRVPLWRAPVQARLLQFQPALDSPWLPGFLARPVLLSTQLGPRPPQPFGSSATPRTNPTLVLLAPTVRRLAELCCRRHPTPCPRRFRNAKRSRLTKQVLSVVHLSQRRPLPAHHAIGLGPGCHILRARSSPKS